MYITKFFKKYLFEKQLISETTYSLLKKQPILKIYLSNLFQINLFFAPHKACKYHTEYTVFFISLSDLTFSRNKNVFFWYLSPYPT